MMAVAAVEKLNKYLDEIERRIPDRELKAEVISSVNVAWQLDHSLKVLISIATALKNSDPAEYRPKLNPWWFLFSNLQWLPRGKGKAPKVVRPEGQINEADLAAQLAEARSLLSELNEIAANSFVSHPYFGHLKLKQAVHFLKIHTHHHLKIVRDILKDQTK